MQSQCLGRIRSCGDGPGKHSAHSTCLSGSKQGWKGGGVGKEWFPGCFIRTGRSPRSVVWIRCLGPSLRAMGSLKADLRYPWGMTGDEPFNGLPPKLGGSRHWAHDVPQSVTDRLLPALALLPWPRTLCHLLSRQRNERRVGITALCGLSAVYEHGGTCLQPWVVATFWGSLKDPVFEM